MVPLLQKMFPVLRFVFVVVSTVKRQLDCGHRAKKENLLIAQMMLEQSSFIYWE